VDLEHELCPVGGAAFEMDRCDRVALDDAAYQHLVGRGHLDHLARLNDLNLLALIGHDAGQLFELAMADLSIPESYRWIPPAVPAGLPFNVAQLYMRMAEGIREGRSVSPDFDVAVKRDQLLEVIQKGSDTGMRQILERRSSARLTTCSPAVSRPW